MMLKLPYRKGLFLFLILSYLSPSAQNDIKSEEKNHQKEISTIQSLPENLPSSFSIPISYLGEEMTLELEKSLSYGKNTRFLIDDGTGKLIEVEKPKECSYIGNVKEHPEYFVNAIICEKGLIGTIVTSESETIEIRPLSKKHKTHEIFRVKTENSHLGKGCMLGDNHEAHDYSMPKIQSSVAKATPLTNTSKSSNKQLLKEGRALTATLPPTTIMDVLEYEIGVEIGSRSFFAEAYNEDLSVAQASAQSIIGNLNRRYLHGSGVKFTLGTVIIRTNISTDPLRDLVTGTGTSSTASSSLAAFKDYWNNNPGEVGTTHDVAVYHVKSAPSGLAYVNKVATPFKYGTMGGNGATSWANGTAVHEVGHIFNLRHTNSSGLFYENRPRVNSGATTAGGRDYWISVMHGSGNRNIGRFSTTEAQVVRQVLNNKRSAGDLVSNPSQIRPFGVYDEYDLPSNNPITIDVIANDYDVNNDVLDVRILDQVSNLGGTISLSAGTGPGGRNEIIYTPPASGLIGKDFFHYTVFDTSGGTDFGAVYVGSEASLFDENSDQFRFDLGTRTSIVWSDYDRVHGDTSNSLYGWTDTTNIGDRDRGSDSGTNNLNRDLCLSSQPGTFETKLRNGKWRVLITFGDRSYSHDNIFVKAEGVDRLENINSTAGAYFNEIFEVDVTDGKLSLEFSDRGGSDAYWTATRIILTYVGALSVGDNNFKNVFSIYPNPANSILNIKIKDNIGGALSIVDVLGNIVYAKKELEMVGGKTAIDVDDWSKGIYFVIFKTDNNKIIKKVIVD
ncbi:T9SS type A sorting domain-containing protein [Flavivirga rizhaonensis]|uniref:T9SS type A sorting domain-containing protein n=1 Tax=Flavivirga rizhaonensis TaxID=2559571 RepID=A0A4S1DUI7_9FLAO|nr:T9SS type A sorting domain-containing protein [Flavivirga rizhaonensis]TGV01687.1 T9SS type A sorting domain-containing protein [Flavivirga rizhaonensis]